MGRPPGLGGGAGFEETPLGVAEVAGVGYSAHGAVLRTPSQTPGRLRQVVESRSMVNGPSPASATAAQARASSSRLTRSNWRAWPNRKSRMKVPTVDGALTVKPSTPCRPADSQRVGVVDAITTVQYRRHQGRHLVSRIRPPRDTSQANVPVHQPPQPQMTGRNRRQDQPGIVHQPVIVEVDVDAAGVLKVVASDGCSLFRVGFSVKMPLSPKRGALLHPLSTLPVSIPSVNPGLSLKSGPNHTVIPDTGTLHSILNPILQHRVRCQVLVQRWDL